MGGLGTRSWVVVGVTASGGVTGVWTMEVGARPWKRRSSGISHDEGDGMVV